ncbi:hypothetical protein [Shewanella sp.]|uniref:hypothetical protein n=1 Tax=Shewanella sp. TaxID=50422 RepID=UPI00356A7EBC
MIKPFLLNTKKYIGNGSKQTIVEIETPKKGSLIKSLKITASGTFKTQQNAPIISCGFKTPNPLEIFAHEEYNE